MNILRLFAAAVVITLFLGQTSPSLHDHGFRRIAGEPSPMECPALRPNYPYAKKPVPGAVNK